MIRYYAMEAVHAQKEHGHKVAGAVLAIVQYLRHYRKSAFTDMDERLAPRLLGQLDPVLLCQTASELDYTNRSETARKAMAEALGETLLPEALPPLELLLDDVVAGVRRQAAKSIARLGDETVRTLIHARLQERIERAEHAIEALCWTDTPTLKELNDEQEIWAGHPDARIRRAVTRVSEARQRYQENIRRAEQLRQASSRQEQWLLANILAELVK